MLWQGHPVTGADRLRFGYMPEERGLYPKMRLIDQLTYFGRLAGMGATAARESARRWVERLGVSDRASDRLEQLSLGNQQRVQLAAALVADPLALVLDEPFSGLDPVGVDVLAATLREEADRGVGVVFSSHQLDLVEDLCDVVTIIDRGRVVASGAIEELRQRDGRRRLRVQLEGGSTAWAADLPGARTASVERDGSVLLELDDATDPATVLDTARAAGRVIHFSFERPTLAALFREVVSALRTPAVVRLVAAREIVERLKQRAFIISTLVTMAVVVLLAALPALLGSDGPERFEVAVTGADADDLAGALSAVGGERIELVAVDGAAEAERLVADEEIDAAVVDGERVVVREDLDDELAALLQAAALQAELGGPPPQLAVEPIDPPDRDTDDRVTLVTFGIMLLYGQLLGYGFWVANGIVEEKTSRVVELLLAKVRPAPLLAGKILGIGTLGLSQLLLLIATGLVAVSVVGEIDLPSGIFGVAAFVLGWFVLGYALYACLFAVAGALASRSEDLQNTAGPLSLVAAGSFIAGITTAGSPGGGVARVTSYIPPSAPLVMPIRIAAEEAAGWEIALAVAVILVAIVGAVLLAGRVYGGGALRFRPTKFREAFCLLGLDGGRVPRRAGRDRAPVRRPRAVPTRCAGGR